jgi:SAM-dependent methyltransferase
VNFATDQVWRSEPIIRRYLNDVRGGIPLAAEQLRLLTHVVGASGRAVHRFLDLGCGDGVLGGALIDEWPDAQGVFLDFAEPMLEAARVKLDNPPGRHAFRLVDYAKVDWTRHLEGLGSFDAVVSGFSIHHREDARKRELYAEVFEMLEPGGIFLNLEHVASASSWGEQVHDEFFVDSLVDFHERTGTGAVRLNIEREYYQRGDKAANRLAPVELQCQWLREIGYVDVDCFFKVFELALFGGMRPS